MVLVVIKTCLIKPRLFKTQVVSKTVRILLANPLQSSSSTFSWGIFLGFFAFKEGMWGLDHRVGHPASFSLGHCSSRWTQGCRRDIDCPQYDSKHRAGLLPEKSLCRRGPVRTREEAVVHRGQTCPLSGAVQSSELMMPKREGPVSSCDLGT